MYYLLWYVGKGGLAMIYVGREIYERFVVDGAEGVKVACYRSVGGYVYYLL